MGFTLNRNFEIFGADGTSSLSLWGRFDVRYYDLIYAPAPKPGTSCKSQFAYWARRTSATEMGLTKNIPKALEKCISTVSNTNEGNSSDWNSYCLYFQWLTCQSPFKMLQKIVSKGSFEIKGRTEKSHFMLDLPRIFLKNTGGIQYIT